MILFDNLYHALHENNAPFMNYIFHHSQYKHEREIEQQKEDAPVFSPKGYDRHADNSLLGSVRRRLIAPKLRSQHSITPPPTTSTFSIQSINNNTNDSKSKMSPIPIELKPNTTKESMVTNSNNGKMGSIFSSPKVNSSLPYILKYVDRISYLSSLFIYIFCIAMISQL